MDFPMKHAPGPNATMLEQLRWAQQEQVRLNQGKDRLAGEVERLESMLSEERKAYHKLRENLAEKQRQLMICAAGNAEETRALRRTTEHVMASRDSARASRDTARRELGEVRAELEKAKAGVKFLQSRLSARNKSNWSLEDDVVRARSEAEGLKAKLVDEQARHEKQVKEWRAVADRLHAEREQLRAKVSMLEQPRREPFHAFPLTPLEKDMQKTIQALKESNAEKQQTIWKQGNRVKQMREARNLWRERAGAVGTLRKELEAERKLNKRIKKALKGKL